MREFDALVETWKERGQNHDNGSDLIALADRLIALAESADDLGQRPYEFGNWEGSWAQVGKQAIVASEKLAAAALALDPHNEAALYLYAQEDFLRRVNQTRPKGEKITGPPVPPPSSSDAAAKIADIVARFEADEQPLSIPSLETIPVNDVAVVDALFRGLESTAWRARLQCIDALGRAEVELERVQTLFQSLLKKGDLQSIDHVAMTLHYHFKAHGVPVLSELMRATKRLVASLSEKKTEDYRHQWVARTVLSLARYTKGEERANIRAFIEELLAAIEKMPAWKKERLFEFRNEAPAILAKLPKR